MSEETVHVVFTPSGKRGRFPVGTPVLTAARQLGVDLDSVCGGRGICSRCQVTPAFGSFPKHGIDSTKQSLSEWNAVEERYRSKRGLAEGRRLGCQAELEADAVIDVPPESQVHRQVVRKAASSRVIEMDPASFLRVVTVEPAELWNFGGDFERLSVALKNQWGLEGLTTTLPVLQKLQKILRAGQWEVAIALYQGDETSAPELLDVWPTLPEKGLFGIAVDLGSTTIAAHLVSLFDGTVHASGGVMNPQIRFGEDLMSRVSYAMMHPEGVAEMTQAVRVAMNGLIAEISAEALIAPELIVEAVFVGNPVMHHLLLGIDPVELGQAPFALATDSQLTLTCQDLELTTLNPAAKIYTLPCIAGHVGADAAAVALSEAPDQYEDMVLVVDVGTNAEILLGNRDSVLACSSPTGPAFEGAQISSGQRAAPGAIERVRIDPETKEPRFQVIGCELWSDDPGFAAATASTGVSGICGSGIIEALAEMRMAGIIDTSGLIGSAEDTGASRIIPDGRTHSYVLHDASADDGPVITVTQGDVRAIQLAKSALYAGARLLMDERGIDGVNKVVLAGAFGAHISPLHAMVLGMIPDCALDQVSSAGNAAGTGAHMALCSRTDRRHIEELVRDIKRVETAVAPKFQEHFVAANALPHATDRFEQLRAEVPLPDLQFSAGDRKPSRRRRNRNS